MTNATSKFGPNRQQALNSKNKYIQVFNFRVLLFNSVIFREVFKRAHRWQKYAPVQIRQIVMECRSRQQCIAWFFISFDFLSRTLTPTISKPYFWLLVSPLNGRTGSVNNI